jgi:hypothetical protein
LTLVIQCAIEVTLKEGGRSWWVSRIDLARSLARLAATVSVHVDLGSVTFEVVYDCVLGIDEFVDVSHEVGYGFSAGFMDLLEELEVGDSLLVVVYHIFILDSGEGVVVLEETIGVLSESFTFAYPYLGEVVSVAGAIVGRLVVRREEP